MCREKRTNRDLRPSIRVLRIGRRRGGCDAQPANDDFTIAPLMGVVQEVRESPCVSMWALFAWAVDNCRMRLADDAVKAASRAYRGRSNAKRLDGADANLIIECDGPRTDRRIWPAFAPRFWTAVLSRRASRGHAGFI